MNKPLALIVEDDRFQADIFSRTLNLVPYETETVFNGREALTRLTEYEPVPDLLILDLHLPSVSGDAIFAELKANTIFEKMKIMIITADSTMLSQIDFDGRKVYTLVKPVNPIQLRKLASRLMPTPAL